MKKKRSKLISMLLTLVMTLSLVPAMGVTASAADGFVEVRTYEQLKTAVDKGNAKVKLMGNIDTTNENGGAGLTSTTNLTFKGGGHVLDLNGHTLKLVTSVKDTHLIAVESQDMTIKDSSSSGSGRIEMEFGENLINVQYPIYISGMGSLTIDGGTFSSSFNFVNYIECYGSLTINGGTIVSNSKRQVNLIKCEDANLTINGGKLQIPDKNEHGISYGYAVYTENHFGDDRQIVITGGEIDGKVAFTRDDSSVTGTPKYNKLPVKITGGVFKQKVYAYYSKKPSGEITEFSPAVELAGGTFKDVYNEDLYSSKGLATKLTAGTFEKSAYIVTHVSSTVMAGYRACLGNSVILRGNECRTAYDWSPMQGFEVSSTGVYLIFREAVVIPNAWGMKSVTLDGKKIDYFKDWKGTVERMDNSTAHTLKFEWYPLASELVNAGYSYNAKCEHYISGSTAVQKMENIDADATSHTVTIEKGVAPKVYSYDLQLNLEKNGSSVGIFTNNHIVKLVVDPAQEIDTRTPIDSVTLNVPKLTEGATSGGNFTLSGTNTGVSTINTAWENIPESGAVAGNFYAARITLTAENGYAFNTSTQVNLNGDYLSTGSGIKNGGAGMTIYVNVLVRHEHTFSGEWQNLNNDKEYHFKTCSCGAQEKEPHNLVYNESLDKYQCSCGYEMEGTKTEIQFVAASPRSPIDGESPSNYTPEQWVHNIGKNYTVASIDWKDEDGNAVTTFESGKIYKGTVTFKADDGFKFDRDRIQFDRIFDTSTTETVEGYNLDEGATTLIATFKLKDNTVVRPGLQVKVKLPSLNDKIGQSFPEAELVNTTLPDDVELTTSVYENIFDDPITGSVKPNKTYFYAVWLKLGNNDSVEAITKKYNVSYTVTDGGDAEYHTDNVAGYGVLARYQTPDAAATSKISSVALTVTAPKYGEAPATTATGANDTLYTVSAPEWSPAVADGKFGADAYTVSIPVTAKSGYSFDANCVYTVNGYLATYASGKVSYTFPKLTVPHEHDYTGQPWQYLDPGSHYQACKDDDGGLNIQAHIFGTWEKVNDDTHKATCSKCKHEKTENHSWNFVKEDAPTLNAAGTRYYGCSANGCEATKTESIPKLTAISAVNVTVTAPAKDAVPGTATTAAGSPYSVANTAWEPLVSGGTFAGGTKYTVKVSLEATGNNRFTDKTTFQINGQTVKPVDTIPATGLDNTIITLTFPATEGGSTGGGSSSGGGGGGVTKYAVAVSPADNGKVTPDKTSAAKGSVVTITAMANDGYALDTIKATDKAGKEIKLTDKGDGKYTFTMPASKVEVKAAFKQTASKPGKPAEEMKTVVVMQVGSKTMFVNGKAYEKDAAPVIMNDRTLVPIRFVTESLGGTVAWNAETKEVTLVIDGKEIKMTIGKTIEKYGVAPVIINGRTFVPVRFVADELGATTAWNAETKTVTITKAVTPVKTEK